jgi:hypothetical protein
MKILKLYPAIDIPARFNYQINYGVWDKIPGDRAVLEQFNGSLKNYDAVLLPMYKRCNGHSRLIDKVKNSRAKAILFDNDSYYRSFSDRFYIGFDYIFYRCLDIHKNAPKTRSSWLPWSIDTELYTPDYTGRGVSFNCAINRAYPMRKKIAAKVKNTRFRGADYIKHLQRSAIGIHASSPQSEYVAAKILEYAACGTHIVSDRAKKIDYYFPDHLISFFNSIPEMMSIIKDYKKDIEVLKEARYITERLHDNRERAKEVMDIIESLT